MMGRGESRAATAIRPVAMIRARHAKPAPRLEHFLSGSKKLRPHFWMAYTNTYPPRSYSSGGLSKLSVVAQRDLLYGCASFCDFLYLSSAKSETLTAPGSSQCPSL